MTKSNVVTHPKILELVRKLRREADRMDELQAAYEAAGGKGDMPMDKPFRWSTEGKGPLSTAEYEEWQKNLDMIRKLELLLNGADGE